MDPKARMPLWMMIEVFVGTAIPAILSVTAAPYLVAMLFISPFWAVQSGRPEDLFWVVFSLSYLGGGMAVCVIWREAILLTPSRLPVILGLPGGVMATWAVTVGLGPEFGALVALPTWFVALHLLWWKARHFRPV